MLIRVERIVAGEGFHIVGDAGERERERQIRVLEVTNGGPVVGQETQLRECIVWLGGVERERPSACWVTAVAKSSSASSI